MLREHIGIRISPMTINVSDTAMEALFETLKASEVEEGKGLRLREEGPLLTLSLDTPRANDTVIDHDGTIVLIVNRDIEQGIGDATVDVDTEQEEPRLVLRRNLSA